MAWKLLEQGHGFGYMEYWDPEDWAHPEYPKEIFPEGSEFMSEEASAGLMNAPWYGGNRFEVYSFNHKEEADGSRDLGDGSIEYWEKGDVLYTYVIHHKEETWNFFRYRKEI